MSHSSLPDFGEFYTQYFNPYEKSFEIRRRSRAEGCLSIDETLEHIESFLRMYQLSYVVNKTDKNLIFFPFMFKKPDIGAKIRNKDTGEIYTVDQIIDNPDTKEWNGLLRLNLSRAPKFENLETLEYLASDGYVRFNREVPDDFPNPVGANLERLIKQPPPLQPTITWTIKSVEPGTLGNIGGSKKEWKPRLRESAKDPLVPGNTVEIYGQFFDNIVQFDCWSNDPRTSGRLVRWFEQFMRLYTGHLRRVGVSQLVFWRRPEEDTNQVWRQSYSVRGTQYLIRTEQLEAVFSRDILNLNISMSVESQISTSNETKWIADQVTSGNLTSQEYRDLFYRSGEYLFGNIDIKQ